MTSLDIYFVKVFIVILDTLIYHLICTIVACLLIRLHQVLFVSSIKSLIRFVEIILEY